MFLELGQSLNTQARMHGECLHLLQAWSTSGQNLAEPSRCKTLKWISPCQAQGEEVCVWVLLPYFPQMVQH